MTIFEALRADHDRQRTLADRLVRTHGDSDERAELFYELKRELQSHAAAEERHFYVPLLQYDLTQEQSRHSVAEHHEIDETISELDTTEFSSPGWLTLAKRLQEQVVHHLEEEEHQVFQLAGRALSDDEKQSLGRGYREEMNERR